MTNPTNPTTTGYTECPYPLSLRRNQVHPNTGEIIDEDVSHVPCRSKGCLFCGPRLLTQQTAHYTRKLKDSPNLRFFTLTVEHRLMESPLEARKYLNAAWASFRSNIAYPCKKRGMRPVWLRAVGLSASGYPHLHIVASIPLEEHEIKERWIHCGGGIVCDVKDIPDTETLACRINYTLRNGFDDAKAACKQDFSPRSISSSQGISFYSKEAKAERKRIALQSQPERAEASSSKPKPCSPDEFKAFLRKALEAEPGQLVATPDGLGSFVSFEEDHVRVYLEDVDATRHYGLFEVTPLDAELPCVEIVEVPRRRPRKRYGCPITEEERERFKLLRQQRTKRYIHTDKDGNRTRWTYDPKTGKLRSELLE